MKKKKILALVLAASMAGGMLAGCGSTSGGDETAKGDKSSGKVYYLNFKPEQADQWVELAKEYTDETGVQVDVQTAASGTYESQLKSEMAKDEAPTLFQVNGPVGLATWKNYCYDLSDSDVYKDVESDDYILKDGDAVDGIAYVIETYGLIYNKALLNKYFELPDASIKSIDDLNNFQALKTVAEEIQAHKDDLGVEGAFTSAGMDSSSDWRFKTHLANLPIYYEYKADGIDSTDAIKGTYLDNYKQIWDLYLNNSTCEPSMISSKTGDDAASEFALGEAVFYQNGTWAYNDIKDNEGAGVMKAHEKKEVAGIEIETLRSNDMGVAFLVKVEGKTIYHAGDLNWWHWNGEPEEDNEYYKKTFQDEMKYLEGKKIDLAFMLLDPRQEDKYCWGMNYFLEHTDSKVVFPMHCFEHYKINHHYLNCEDGRRWKNIVRDITGAGQVFEI